MEGELEVWRERVVDAKKETEQRRRHYRHQEEELQRTYEKSYQQLLQRRDTLLATTSLIPYTQTIQTIQQANSFRIPAALLLQARLCMNVHCLCVHEELLLRTKEQGWDTIAWMEDVSRQLRMLMQKQILLLHVKMQEKVELLQKMNLEAEIPESIKYTLQQRASPVKDSRREATPIISAASDPEKQTQQKQEGPTQERTQSKDESFLEFLQKYEQRKDHQQKADQMRLAQFRSRGAGASAENPYTRRRAGVGKKLKSYATKLFQGGGTNSNNFLHTVDGQAVDDRSLQVGRLNIMSTVTDCGGDSSHPSRITEESAARAADEGTDSSRQSWIPFVRQQKSTPVVRTQSQSEIQDRGWSLGNSLRGFRKRGSRKPLDIDTGKTRENSGIREEMVSDQQEKGNRHHCDTAATDDNGDINSLCGDDMDNAVADLPSNNSGGINNHGGENESRRQLFTVTTSKLKNTLKAPVVASFHESARF